MRVKNDLYIVSILKNWPEVLLSKIKGEDFDTLSFRNGLTLRSPAKVRLEMIFHEVWVKKMYSPKGYEIKKGDVVIDIGANIGVFSIYAATQAEDVRVYALEPFPENCDWLKRNVEENELDNVVVFEKAVSGDSKAKTLYVSDAWVGHSLNNQEESVGKIEIECVTLDDLTQTVAQCDLLKIDCEGCEYDVLYNSSYSTFRKIRKIVGEYHDIDSDRMTGKSLCDFLVERRFEITHYNEFHDGTGSFCAFNSER
jgi:FkbM family methyltransferase